VNVELQIPGRPVAVRRDLADPARQTIHSVSGEVITV
jgi:hypothetical protein